MSKAAVDLVRNTNLTLTQTSTDFTYSVTTVGDLVVDGITVVVGDKILFRSQTNSAQNIIVEITSITDLGGSNQYTMEMPQEIQLLGPLDYVYIERGDEFGGSVMLLISSSVPFTWGVSSVNWNEIGENIGSTNTIGDTREACGASFVSGLNVPVNADLDGKGEGIVTLSNSGNNITISADVTNPNFIDLGYIAGDNIYVYDNTFVFAKFEISVVAAQTLTLTAAAPTLGNIGSAICLVPNQQLSIDELTTIASNVLDKDVIGYEIILDEDTDPNVVNMPYQSSLKIQHCVMATVGISMQGYAAIEFSRCTFFNSSADNFQFALTCESKTTNFINECYIFGSKNLYGNNISGIKCKIATQLNMLYNTIVGFDEFGVEIVTVTFRSEFDRFANINNGIYNIGGPSSIIEANMSELDGVGILLADTAQCNVYFPVMEESAASNGIQAENLSSFSFTGDSNDVNVTTPFDPAVQLVPNATGGNGVGYA